MLTLRIKNPSLKDAGLYRCNAFNESGDSNANIDLKFESKSIQKIFYVLGTLFPKDVFLIKSCLMTTASLIGNVVSKIFSTQCEKKNVLLIEKIFAKFFKFQPQSCKRFEITRTIYSNSKRSEQFLVIECFFNLFLQVSNI